MQLAKKGLEMVKNGRLPGATLKSIVKIVMAQTLLTFEDLKWFKQVVVGVVWNLNFRNFLTNEPFIYFLFSISGYFASLGLIYISCEEAYKMFERKKRTMKKIEATDKGWLVLIDWFNGPDLVGERLLVLNDTKL